MGVFDFLTRKAAIVRDAADDVANQIRYRFAQWGSVVPAQAKMEAERAVLHPVVFRCVDRIALVVQGVDWYVQKKGERDPQKRDYKAGVEKDIAALLDDPNDEMSAAQLRYWLALNLAIYGNAFLKIGIDRAKKTPNGIYPLLTGKTTQAQAKGIVTGYQTWTPGGEILIPTRRTVSVGGKPQEAYAGHIYKPALDYVNKTHSPLQSLGVAPVIWSSLMDRALETAQGQPNLKHVVTAEGALTAKQAADFADALNDRRTGSEASGNVLFIEGVKASFATVDDGMKDIHSKLPLDDMTRQIAAIYGVPIPLLGLAAADGAKFAGNYAEARLSFVEDTVIPGYLAPIEDAMTRMLCPDGYEVRFDLDSIECLRNRRMSVGKDVEVLTYLTTNEKRQLVGFGKLPGKEYDELSKVPQGTISAPQPGVTATPPAEPAADDEPN